MPRFIISIMIPLMVGAIAGFFTGESVNSWYVNVNKPSFNPPSWLFAPVWTALYLMMGIAFCLGWKAAVTDELKKQAMTLYAVQLFINFIWSFIFFYLQQPGWAMVDFVLMWIMILLTVIWFGKIAPVAAWLLVPYICWVSFAALLNYSIWKLN